MFIYVIRSWHGYGTRNTNIYTGIFLLFFVMPRTYEKNDLNGMGTVLSVHRGHMKKTILIVWVQCYRFTASAFANRPRHCSGCPRTWRPPSGSRQTPAGPTHHQIDIHCRD